VWWRWRRAPRPRRSVHNNRVGCGIEPRNGYFAGAETVNGVEGNMCGAVMRGAVALPGSEATSRTKGARWNLGDLVWPAVAVAIRAAAGRRGAEAAVEQARSRTSLVVLAKRPNKAAMSGGGGRGGKGARSEGWQTTGDAPGAEPDQASCTRRLPADRRCGTTSALARSRPTSGKSPVRESRTPGSVRGAGRNPCPYRDSRERINWDADAVVTAEGETGMRVNASAFPVLRGPRPWHVRTLLERKPGDLDPRVKPGGERSASGRRRAEADGARGRGVRLRHESL